METTQEKKLRTLSEAAEYLGFSEPKFRHIFYNVNGKQLPKPKYVGKKFSVNGVDKEIKAESGLHFTQQSLDEYLNV